MNVTKTAQKLSNAPIFKLSKSFPAGKATVLINSATVKPTAAAQPSHGVSRTVNEQLLLQSVRVSRTVKWYVPAPTVMQRLVSPVLHA